MALEAVVFRDGGRAMNNVVLLTGGKKSSAWYSARSLFASSVHGRPKFGHSPFCISA